MLPFQVGMDFVMDTQLLSAWDRILNKSGAAFQLNSKLQHTSIFTQCITIISHSSWQVALLFNIIFSLSSVVSHKHGDHLTKPGPSCYFYPGAANSKSDNRMDGGSGLEREKSGRKKPECLQ